MRLIDADRRIDELKAFANSDIATKEDKETAGRIATYIETVAQARTVEAIPIEWLERWSRLYLAPTKEYTDIIEDIIRDYREEQSNEGQGGR